MKNRKKLSTLLITAGILWLIGYVSLLLLNHLYPLSVERFKNQSLIITDKNDAWLQVYLTRDDKRRILTTPRDVTERYLQLLINYEDKDFYEHNGIDWLALLRATKQNILAGRVVSGASTLTMQTARLLHPRPRTLRSKIIEAFRAWQLERTFSKNEILTLYLTLAPAGGNLEGLQSAAYYYLDKPLNTLSLAESAWLVALPQSPQKLTQKETVAATTARNKVLKRAYDNTIITHEAYTLAVTEKLKLKRTPFPFIAPHISEKAKKTYFQRLPASSPYTTINHTPFTQHTSIDSALQRALTDALKSDLSLKHPNSNRAGGIIDNTSGEWLAYVGSADFFSTERNGQVDTLNAVRSPGSTLKPFITLYAFDWLNYQPQTTIDDTPIRGSTYQPSNYDAQYQGRISLADALQRSRNIPAVRLLAKIQPDYFVNALKTQGVPLFLPRGARPNLSIALGGVGIKGTDLAQLYSRLAQCAYTIKPIPQSSHNTTIRRKELAKQASCWKITNILRTSHDGQGRIYFGSEPVAFKTGTAYGWRDRWIVAYTKQYTIIVWSGRADGKFSEQKASAESLIPVLRQVVSRLPNPPRIDPQQRPKALLTGHSLPAQLQHISSSSNSATNTTYASPVASTMNQLSIVAPIHESNIDYIQGMTINFRITGGTPPFIYLLNNEIIENTPYRHKRFEKTGPGIYSLTVIDSTGNAANSTFRLSKSSKEPVQRAVFD